ncbi:MAG: helix-turn-helix domain-containing protein [Clostridiales bacterium]|nr:helix-turn-helix domain-containing protein [Clostridiales bacterium]
MAKQTIGEFLATLRKANGYTQQEVADRLGISNRTLSGWECDKVLPDILLLPVLAELYGVTVDEILAGERKENSKVAISDKSEVNILKSKLARFSMQCWILLGVIIAGIVLTAVSAYIEVTNVAWVGFPWWRLLLIVGIVFVILCLAILIAFFKSSELSVDDAIEKYNVYCLILSRKFGGCLFALAAVNTVAAIIVTVVLLARGLLHGRGIVTCAAFGVFAIILYLTGWLIYKHALTVWGGDNARNSIRRDKQYFWVVGFWGTIPLVLSVILAIVFGCVQFENRTTIYANGSVEQFVTYMETLVDDTGVERQFPLSKLAKNAKIGEKVDLGDGYTAIYYLTTVEIQYEQTVYLPSDDGDEMGEHQVTVSTYAPLILVNDGQDLRFYNLRYWYNGEIPQYYYGRYVIYEGYVFERAGDGLAYVYLITHDYSAIGYAVAIPVIVADLIVCASLCVWKRYKYKIRL